jgi:hypothetical protein
MSKMAWLKKIAEVIIGSEDFSDIKSSTLRDVLNGEILSKNFFKKQYGLIIMISLLAFFYVDNRYSCETQLAKSIELKKQIMDAKYESLTISAQLMELSRQSNVLKAVKDRGLGLVQPVMPPVVLEDSVTQH